MIFVKDNSTAFVSSFAWESVYPSILYSSGSRRCRCRRRHRRRLATTEAADHTSVRKGRKIFPSKFWGRTAHRSSRKASIWRRA